MLEKYIKILVLVCDWNRIVIESRFVLNDVISSLLVNLLVLKSFFVR